MNIKLWVGGCNVVESWFICTIILGAFSVWIPHFFGSEIPLHPYV